MEIPFDEAQKIKPTTIKVLLEEQANALFIEAKGSYKVFCPTTNVLLSSGSHSKQGVIRSSDHGLVWGDLFPGIFGIRLVPSHSNSSIFVNGLQYKGCVEVYDIAGKLRVINEVDVENYLRSCLATQFFHVTEVEALSTIAILERTQIYRLIAQSPNAPWHVTAKQTHYTGFGSTYQHLPLEQAITQTRHAILTKEHHPFAATWNESEGEGLQNSWSFQMSKKELAQIAHLAKLSHLALCAEKESGKVYAVKMTGEDQTATVDFVTLQNALGKSKLKSNHFVMEVLDDAVRFKGQGEKVSLNLQTAHFMAKQGMGAQEILQRFFPQVEIEKLEELSELKK